MTKLLVIVLCLWGTFWLQTKWLSIQTSLYAKFSAVWLPPFPKTKYYLKGNEISITAKTAGRPCLPTKLQTVRDRWSLSLEVLQRLSRRQHGSKCNRYGEMNSSGRNDLTMYVRTDTCMNVHPMHPYSTYGTFFRTDYFFKLLKRAPTV
jgi:hypothetical protein